MQAIVCAWMTLNSNAWVSKNGMNNHKTNHEQQHFLQQQYELQIQKHYYYYLDCYELAFVFKSMLV